VVAVVKLLGGDDTGGGGATVTEVGIITVVGGSGVEVYTVVGAETITVE
jgi:hypothetical protein